MNPTKSIDIRDKRRFGLGLVAAALAATLAVAGCAGSSSGSGSGGSKSVALVAYSTPKRVYTKLIAAYQATPQGRGVTFTQSYGASGDQSRAIVSGLPADVVNLSLAPDVDRLVKAGLVSSSWDHNQHKGMVTNSTVAFIVRKGNPKHITGWDDLTKPGLQVLTPNPFSSGSARWNVMAAYGAQIEEGRSPAQAAAYLKQLFKNVPVQDKSAQDALQTFASGKGDVLISYEDEAIADTKKDPSIDYFVPKQTILIENPLGVTTQASSAGKAFAAWLTTPAAQKIWAQSGYRPVVSGVAAHGQFPTPSGLFTIEKFGGWTTVTKKFFDPQTGLVAGVERSLGVSTASK
jgi:sulfate/thiosulfate-binding protein